MKEYETNYELTIVSNSRSGCILDKVMEEFKEFNKEQAEILEDLLLISGGLNQNDFDKLEQVQAQITQLIENDEWED